MRPFALLRKSGEVRASGSIAASRSSRERPVDSFSSVAGCNDADFKQTKDVLEAREW